MDTDHGGIPADALDRQTSLGHSGDRRWKNRLRVVEVASVALALLISLISLVVAIRADQRLASEEDLELADQVLVVVDPYFMRETGSGITVRNYGRLPLAQLVVWVPTDSRLKTTPDTAAGFHYSLYTPPGPCEEVLIEFNRDFPPSGEGIVAFQDANGQLWQRSGPERATKMSERVMRGIWESADGGEKTETRSPIAGCAQAS